MEFWRKWKSATLLEKAGIKSVKKAKRIVLKSIPRDKIVSVYVSGSFVRREMTGDSDVDVLVITSDAKGQLLVSKMIREYDGKDTPFIGFSGYSLWELRTGKPLKYLAKKMRTAPDRWVKNLVHYELIYGRRLNPADFAVRRDRDDLRVLVGVFYSKFLPLYEKGKLGFQSVLKQVFWLADLELKLKGKHPSHSWKEIANLAGKGHIVRLALKLRHSNSGRRVRDGFIVVLKEYLKELRKLC